MRNQLSKSRTWKAIAALAVLAAAVSMIATVSSASTESDDSPPSTPSEATPHCAADVIPAEDLGKVEPEFQCYASYADVLRSRGYQNVPDDAQPGDETTESTE